eukprot:5332684-Pyramimonas_sp.AAC.1
MIEPLPTSMNSRMTKAKLTKPFPTFPKSPFGCPDLSWRKIDPEIHGRVRDGTSREPLELLLTS